jgi:hypothetical protein
MKHRISCAPTGRKATNLSDIVGLYIAGHRTLAERELTFFRIQRTLGDAILKAGTARTPSGKCHDHQRRVGNVALNRFTKKLLNAEQAIRRARDFGRLHEIVHSVGKSMPRIGALTIYDTAHRIGAYLGLEPDKVYLHTGTLDGARKLGLATGNGVLDKSQLPKEFHRLKPYEIEDCLCIYKDKIASIAKRL